MESLDGEAVLYSPELGSVHRFDSTTLVVWNACDGSRTLEEIVAMLSTQSEMDHVEAQEFAQQIVAELIESDLVVVKTRREPAAGETPNGTKVSKADDRDVARIVAQPVREGVLSRRELLRGGAGKLVLGAPVISSFFATGAYASGMSASAAFGAGNCKNVGYSCAVNTDCCGNQPSENTICWGPTSTCCVQEDEACTTDADCCPDASDGCVDGTCED